MKPYFTRLSTFSTFSTFIFITESNKCKKKKNIKKKAKREWGAVAWSIYRLNIGR